MANKYKYLKVIQQDTGIGWEDVSDYETDSYGIPTEKTTDYKVTKSGRKLYTSLLKYDLKSYRETGYPTRVIKRRILNENNIIENQRTA